MSQGSTRKTLASIAHGRSGDKGNHANVAILGYSQDAFDWLIGFLSKEKVEDYFKPLGVTQVERYLAPNVRGLNFVLKDVLAGGSSASLRSDSQGKTLAAALLLMPLPPDCPARLFFKG
ncbi:MAG: hypothetical protein EXR99_08115 [Gemmataceae bacterium]|nr:hypothetical protein [Gemmataceae bacterium]